MINFKNKFEVISYEQISKYVDGFYEKYRVYMSAHEVKKIFPNYVNYKDHYSGQINYIFFNGEKSYVIFNPNESEKEKQKDFRRFEKIRGDLLALRNLQKEHSKRRISQSEANDIESQIDDLISILPIVQKNIKYSFKTMNEIALFYFYNKVVISRANANGIALDFGYGAKTSGEKLYQKYIQYSSRSNRIGNEVTTKKLKNKINLINSVVEKLSDISKKEALEEIKLLKNHL